MNSEEGSPKKINKFWQTNKIKITVILLGLIVILALGYIGTDQLSKSPQFCAKCHEMTPEYVTWKASVHSQIACASCHNKPGLGNLISNAFGSNGLTGHMTKSYNVPIKAASQIGQDVCKQCHSTHRTYNLSGDLIVPHDKHSAKNIDCIACHTDVAHGGIVRKGLTKNGNNTIWTANNAVNLMNKEDTKPKMNTCLACHTKRGITTACEACHSIISEPADHKAYDWTSVHGKKAEKDFNYCNKCHSFSITGGKNSANISDYVKSNSYCRDCHKKRPADHGTNWLSIHSAKALPDKIGCLVCHSQSKPKPEDNLTTTYCFQCHGNANVNMTGDNTNNEAKTKNTGAFSYHDSNWIKNHPNYIKDQGIQKGKCFSCHESTQCSNCHSSNGKLH